MSPRRPKGAPTPLSQRDLDFRNVLAPVLEGQRAQAKAARFLDPTPRHGRRLVARLREGGDAGLRHRVLDAYRHG